MFKSLSLFACLTALGLIANDTRLIGQTGPVREEARRAREAAIDSPRIQTDTEVNLNQQQLNDDGQIQDNLNASHEQDRHESGYRGVDSLSNNSDQTQRQPGQVEFKGQVYRVRHDRNGREFICVCGCPVYLDSQDSSEQPHEAYKLSDEKSQNHNDQVQTDGKDHQSDQSSVERSTYVPNSGGAPNPPVPIRTDIDSTVPATPNLESNPASPSISSEPAIQPEQNQDLDDSVRHEGDVNDGNSADVDSAKPMDMNNESQSEDANDNVE